MSAVVKSFLASACANLFCSLWWRLITARLALDDRETSGAFVRCFRDNRIERVRDCFLPLVAIVWRDGVFCRCFCRCFCREAGVLAALLHYHWSSAVVKANSLILCIPASILIERQAISNPMKTYQCTAVALHKSHHLPPTDNSGWSGTPLPSSSLFCSFPLPRANFYTFILRIFTLHRIVSPSVHLPLHLTFFLSFSFFEFFFFFPCGCW